MTTPTIGEFLAPASKHIDAAVSFRDDLPDAARLAAIRQLDRLVAALARNAADATVPGESDPADPTAASIPDLNTLQALRNAAGSTRRAGHTTDDSAAGLAHPAVQHLAAAADLLAASSDVLRTHFVVDREGVIAGATHWAPVITSPSVAAAMAAELGGYARRLAPWTARLAVASDLIPPRLAAAPRLG